MKTKKLTALSLPNLSVGDYPDHIFPGLTFRVGLKRKTWTLRHRIGDKQRRETLGFYFGDDKPNSMGLAAAREKAREIAGRIDAGAPLEPPPVHPRQGGITLEQLIDRYEKMRRKEGGRVKSLDEALRTVRRGLKDYVKLPARQFSKADLRAARDAINEGNSHMGNRLLGYTSPILKWAASEDIIDFNFASAIRRATESKRERTLTRTELKAIWQSSYELGSSVPATNFGALIRFLIATGQRIGEAASMKHGDILNHVWRQTMNKASREHRLKLPQIALDQIGKGEMRDLVFAGEKGTKIGAVSKFKTSMDELSGVSDWRIHDLRRTFASLAQEAGISETAIRAVLNHAIAGVAQVYLRGELDRQKADALNLWGREVEKIIGIRRAA